MLTREFVDLLNKAGSDDMLVDQAEIFIMTDVGITDNFIITIDDNVIYLDARTRHDN